MTRATPQPQGVSGPASAAAEIPTRDILGTPVALTDYRTAIDAMDGMVESRERGYVCAVAVHALTVGYDDPEMGEALRGATLVLPDGMPVVWAANLLGGNLDDRVYGPELMLRYNDRCAERGHRVWLYGGRDQGSLVQLALNLRKRHPGINIVGGYSPPFRPMTAEEEDALVEQINEARPDVLWVGIGVPKQEKWMARMRERLDVPVMCAVGAAFDFHAGPHLAGAVVDAGARARVDLPDRSGAAPAAAALPLLQPALRAGVCAPVPRASVNRLPRMEASVAVIGLGRVGLPLALSFADRGLRTIGVERQQGVLDQLSAGQMPFSETGTQELLERVLEGDRLELTRAVQDAAQADHIVLTPAHALATCTSRSTSRTCAA